MSLNTQRMRGRDCLRRELGNITVECAVAGTTVKLARGWGWTFPGTTLPSSLKNSSVACGSTLHRATTLPQVVPITGLAHLGVDRDRADSK